MFKLSAPDFHHNLLVVKSVHFQQHDSDEQSNMYTSVSVLIHNK